MELLWANHYEIQTDWLLKEGVINMQSLIIISFIRTYIKNTYIPIVKIREESML